MTTKSDPKIDEALRKPGPTVSGEEHRKHDNFRLHKIYLKDLSYESPNTPMIFGKSVDPQYKVNLDTHYTHAGNGDYEVELMTTVSVTAEQMTVFVIEVKMVGLFSFVGFSKEVLERLLGSDCPGMIYPYVREIISDMSTRGGFFPIVLHLVNFDQLFLKKQQQLQQQQRQQQALQQPS